MTATSPFITRMVIESKITPIACVTSHRLKLKIEDEDRGALKYSAPTLRPTLRQLFQVHDTRIMEIHVGIIWL